jgi:hypothetical protein
MEGDTQPEAAGPHDDGAEADPKEKEKRMLQTSLCPAAEELPAEIELGGGDVTGGGTAMTRGPACNPCS